MGLLEKVVAARGRKDFVEPPFWELEALRWPWMTSSSTAGREKIENDFEGYVSGAFKDNPIVFGCIDRRQQVFSQARFAWRQFVKGRPGNLFGDQELALLERPWPTGTTGELLAHMEADASLAGNSYWTTVDDSGRVGRSASGSSRRLARLRPDWVTIVVNVPWDADDPWHPAARVVAYEYRPVVSPLVRPEPWTLLPQEICHYSPKPDPLARFRGMSWITPVIREVMGDKAATRHKLKFFENGATSTLALKYPSDVTDEQFKNSVELFNAAHKGVDQAYKTFHVRGADPTPLSANLQQLEFRATQGAGETRLSVAAGVPAAILGISEGLQGSTLNSGNFMAAKRLFVESTLWDLWAKAAASLQVLVTPSSPGQHLWFDARDIPFLREDADSLASIRLKDAQTLRTLVDGGFNPDAAVDFVESGDLARLRANHSGLLPVQLQPPGSGEYRSMNGSHNRSANGQQAVPAR